MILIFLSHVFFDIFFIEIFWRNKKDKDAAVV